MCRRVSSFCCGCSLEEGCKVTVILGLVVGGIGLIRACVTTDWVEITSNVLWIVAAGLLLYGVL